MAPALRDVCTLREIAARTGKTYPTIYGRALRGDYGEPMVVGGVYFYDRAHVESVLARDGASASLAEVA